MKNLTNNFKLRNCLFCATNIVKHNDKEKWVYSGHGIAFDEAGSWNFSNDFSRNVIIFGVDNGSCSHVENSKNNFLVLGKRLTYFVNGSFHSPDKRFSINFSKANSKFCFSFHYNDNNSYFFVNGKEIKFKIDQKC